jgi:hypothetical protein
MLLFQKAFEVNLSNVAEEEVVKGSDVGIRPSADNADCSVTLEEAPKRGEEVLVGSP